MTFGNDQTYALIGEILEQADESLYDPLLLILYEDTQTLINRYCNGVGVSDKEDMLQDVVIKVFKNLPVYYKNSAEKTVGERNSWLREVVINTRNDLIRKLKRTVEASAAEYNDALEQPSNDDFMKKLETREAVFEALRIAFQMQTTAEKLLAFVYNRVLYAMSGKSGSPKDVSGTFCGMSLRKMYAQMVSDLSDVLQCNVPAACLEPLKQKIEERPDDLFSLSPRTITESGNFIVSRIKELSKNG